MKQLLQVVILFLTLSAFSQQGKPIYDEALAKKLGADEHGMKNYVLVILKTGDKVIDQAQRTEIFAGHMKNIQKMASEGMLAVAGPFGENSSNYRGLYIFNVATVDQARVLAESDPAVKSGLMKPEYYLWYGSATMMEVNGIHEKITKKAF